MTQDILFNISACLEPQTRIQAEQNLNIQAQQNARKTVDRLY